MHSRGDLPVWVLASRVRSEEKSIMQALERRGVVWRRLDPRELQLQAAAAEFADGIFLMRDLALVRASMVAHCLQAVGREVINHAEAIDTCGNKWSTALALQQHQVPTPATWAAMSLEAALGLIDSIGYPVVLKPQVSSWGRRVSLIRDRFAAEAVLEHCDALASPQAKLPLIQEYIPGDGSDIRVLVVGERPIAAMRRRGTGQWRNNVAMGARTEPCHVDDRIGHLAVAAAAAVGAAIAGVDLLERKPGEYVVLEVNAGVEFAGLEAQTGCDAAGHIADLCIATSRLCLTGAA